MSLVQLRWSSSSDVGEEAVQHAYCLLLPGKILNLSYLLRLKKFRKRGNKDGAVSAFYQLQYAELGRVIEIGGS